MRNVGTLHPSLLSMIGAMCVLNLVGQVAFASPEMNISVPQLFSTEWLEDYAAGNRGCGMARGSYVWRYHGFGSNMNSEFAARAAVVLDGILHLRLKIA